MIMQNNTSIKLNVIGNADKTGSEDFNQDLALKRANQVINYLNINFGINKDRFKALSNGETKPIYNKPGEDNESIDQFNPLLEINRRVDFEIIY